LRAGPKAAITPALAALIGRRKPELVAALNAILTEADALPQLVDH
jgi:hypothetical protein